MTKEASLKISEKALKQGARAIRGLSSGERAFAESERNDGDNTIPVRNLLRNDMSNVALQEALKAAVGASPSDEERQQALSAMLDYGRAHPRVR